VNAKARAAGPNDGQLDPHRWQRLQHTDSVPNDADNVGQEPDWWRRYLAARAAREACWSAAAARFRQGWK